MQGRYRLPPPLRVLMQTQYGSFFLGNGLSLVGTWMQRVACGWLVWDWTHSAFWLGILAAGDLLPVVFIGPFAGVAADRWNRQRQNMIAQALSAVLAVLMALLLAIGKLDLMAVILLITAQGVLTAAVQPARLAMVQQLVPRGDMAVAVALSSVNVNLARLLGPALAGAMILKLDILWIFVLNAAVTLLFVAMLARLRPATQQYHHGDRAFLSEMAAGFAHILKTPTLRLILVVMLLGGILVRAIVELLPAVAGGVFPDDPAGLAILTSAAAVGAVGAGLSVGRVAARSLFLGVPLWWGAGALMNVVLTQAEGPWLASAAAVAVGAIVTRGLITAQTFVQLTTPDRLRGRVLGVHTLITRGSPAIGALALGYAADRVGLAAAFLVASGALLLALLAALPLIRAAARAVEAE